VATRSTRSTPIVCERISQPGSGARRERAACVSGGPQGAEEHPDVAFVDGRRALEVDQDARGSALRQLGEQVGELLGRV